jgi:PAS domain S-box-containing protein
VNKKHPKSNKERRRTKPSRPRQGKTEAERKTESLAAGTLAGERYKAFIENIDDGVYEVDLSGNFLYFNEALCHVFGFPREEIHGQNFSKFMDQDRARAAFEIFNKIYTTGKGFKDLIWEIISQEGQKRIIELSANLIINKEGKKVGFRGIARDVTERFKAQEELKQSELRYQCAYEASRVAEQRSKTLLDFIPFPMVVFTLDGKVSYLNPAFTDTFGWTLPELQGKYIPYVPLELQGQTQESIRKLFEDKVIPRQVSRRLTKDGRILDVMMSGAVFFETEEQPAGELVLLRDITQEKKLTETNDTLLRISMALPSYPFLEDLLDYISTEIKQLLNVEGALVILLDEEKNELFFMGAAYDDQDTQKKAKEVRYPADRGVSGKVVRTGEPVIVQDTSKDPNFYTVVDDQLHFKSRSILDVPLRTSDRIIGVLCAINKKEGIFDQTDVELLNLIAGTVALSIENARFSEEIKQAYREVRSLNRAKDRVINRLSHELKTPASILLASLKILRKRLESLPEESWKPTIDRAWRNVNRILDIQYEVQDIMQDKHYKTYELLTLLLDQCTDELEALVAEEVGEGSIIERIRSKINRIYGPKESKISDISLDQYVIDRLKVMKPAFVHREVEIVTHTEPVPRICVPEDVLEKVVDGLTRNAIEATPDEGRIEVIVRKKGDGAELIIHDRGIGITDENKERIFEGFFSTQETMSYSSRRPYDFYAGGKGADLLRMKIFSERYNFKIDMTSSRCVYIPKDSDLCPGRISECKFCKTKKDCYLSGGTAFNVFFPPAPDQGCALA